MFGFDIKGFINGLRNYNLVPAKKAPAAPKPKPRADIELPGCERRWKGIVWHHSKTADTPNENWKAIKRYHTAYRIDGHIVTREEFYQRKKAKNGQNFVMPWSDIGYHAGMERINGILRWRLGRSWDKSGAHAGHPGNARFNRYYLGICAVGDFDKVAPDKERWQFALEITRTIMDEFGMKTENILGHRETYALVGRRQAKSCPGDMWDMEKFRKEL